MTISSGINNEIIVVGGFPEPIGGVTSFIKRLAASNMVSEVIDLYPSKSKTIPNTYKGNVLYFNGILKFVLFYFMNSMHWRHKTIHFNFSRANSLVLFLFLPKFGSKFHLMLHHGELNQSRVPWLYSILLKRFDVIHSMNDKQDVFFLQNKVSVKKVKRNLSYVKPVLDAICMEKKVEIDVFFSESNVVVASGRPDSLYNHLWNIDYVSKNNDLKLALFIYGEGNSLDKIKKKTNGLSNVKVFYDCNEDVFLYALSKAKLYSRPTKIDSFGIAVADAIELNVAVLASNVCRRYPGTYTFRPTCYRGFKAAIDSALIHDGNGYEISDDVINPFQY